MSLARSALILTNLVTVLTLTACGPEPRIETLTSAEPQTPSCAPSCETACWVELKLREGDDLAQLWLFDADEYPSSALEGAKLHLEYGTTTFDGDFPATLPSPMPSTLELDWDLPSSFDAKASGLTATVLVDATPSELECGLAIIE